MNYNYRKMGAQYIRRYRKEVEYTGKTKKIHDEIFEFGGSENKTEK